MAQEFNDFEIDGIDFSDIPAQEGGSFDLVEPGVYVVEVSNVTQKDTKTNKTMITVEFKITDQQESEGAQKFAGQRLWNNYFPTGKPWAQGRLVQLMKACGAPLDRFRASALLGAQLRVDVYHEKSDDYVDGNGNEQEGRVFARVSKESPTQAAQETAPPPPPASKAKPAGGSAKPNSAAPAARRA